MSGLAGLSLSSKLHILGKIPPLTRGLRPQMTLMAASHDDNTQHRDNYHLTLMRTWAALADSIYLSVRVSSWMDFKVNVSFSISNLNS